MKIDTTDLIRYKIMMRDEMPQVFRRVIADYINTSAFTHRSLNLKNMHNKFTIRDERFLNSSLRVETTRPVPINQQIAFSGSIKRERFTGWAEQQLGTAPKRKRTILPAARAGGTGKAKPKARLRPGNQIYKPSQFKNNYQFMMRVIGSRGGGTFLLEENIKTKRGQLHAGLYELRKHNIYTLQKTKKQRAEKREWLSDDWSIIRSEAHRSSMIALDKWKKIYAVKNGLT